MNKILELFNNKEFIIMDGAMGTMLQAKGLDTGRVAETLNITNKEDVKSIHKEYIEAGSDMINTCSFGVTEFKVEGSGYTVEQLMEAAVNNAEEAVKESGKDVKIALDVGPIGRLLEPNGNLPFEEAVEVFKRQIRAGKGADLIVIETMTDLYELKAALLAAKEETDLPVICTMSFEADQRTFTGTEIRSMALTLEGLGADAIGLNCSLGPDEFKPIISKLSEWTTLPIVSKANAGLPDPETGEYMVSAKEFAELTADLVPYGLKFAGGCCGTNPEYIKELTAVLSQKKYCRQNPEIPSAVCTPENTVIIDRPRVIGERINPTGKKKLKAALLENNMDYILNQAADQIRDGAELLDVNTGVPGLDEKKVIVNVIKSLQGITNAPLVVDSNDPEVIEAALRVYSGKAIVNSVNGEETSLNTILPIVKKYGAAVIGLTLDEDGIPVSVEKRVEIAEKIMNRAMAAGIPKRDIFIDCLTLTVSAEQKNASNTLKAIEIVKNRLGLKTVLGVSNISFGLPNRGIINHNFLQMALYAGLDLPIMNPAASEMMESVAVYNLIMNIDNGATEYIKKYSVEKKSLSVQNDNTVRTEEKLSELEYAIRNGLTGKCKELVEKELINTEPMNIINDQLIPVLDRAGKDFENGKIFIPQLMLTASTAQAAFDVVKTHLKKTGGESASRGKVITATVRGDIHDIGKNIVKVILENYGYEVIDLGKDVEAQAVLDAVKQENVQLVGLSALMTTTLPSMKETINLIKKEAPHCKIMVGGAVLTYDYAMSIGADFYVKDAKESADRAKEVLG